MRQPAGLLGDILHGGVHALPRGRLGRHHELRDALHDGRLADARVPNQARVVLGAPQDDLRAERGGRPAQGPCGARALSDSAERSCAQ